MIVRSIKLRNSRILFQGCQRKFSCMNHFESKWYWKGSCRTLFKVQITTKKKLVLPKKPVWIDTFLAKFWEWRMFYSYMWKKFSIFSTKIQTISKTPVVLWKAKIFLIAQIGLSNFTLIYKFNFLPKSMSVC